MVFGGRPARWAPEPKPWSHREALGGVVDEHEGHEVQARRIQRGEHERQVLGRPLRELVPVLRDTFLGFRV